MGKNPSHTSNIRNKANRTNGKANKRSKAKIHLIPHIDKETLNTPIFSLKDAGELMSEAVSQVLRDFKLNG